MDDTNYYENMIAGLRADIEQADKASAQLECMYNTCCEERTELRAERDALADEVRGLDIELTHARDERDAYRYAMAKITDPAAALAALQPLPPIIMPAQDWELNQTIQTLNERIAYLEPIFIAARNLVDNAEEYECDGLGLWAQHGWWEPLHDALDPDGSEAADDIRKSVAPAKKEDGNEIA